MLSIIHDNSMQREKPQVHEVGGQAAEDQTEKTKQVSIM